MTMIKVHSKATNQTIEVDRYIGKIKGAEKGASIIFLAGIHGNEPSGVFALQQVLKEIKDLNCKVKGNVYAIAGNLWALERAHRYDKQDLNRLWTNARVNKMAKNELAIDDEDSKQQVEIQKELDSILSTDDGPFYFMDLHTTSSQTAPFLTVNDSLLNRKFTQQFPCASILGIEEYLTGPLLSYINELGFVSFGFEGGQHDNPLAIENHIAFIYLSLVYAGIVSKNDIDYTMHFDKLRNAGKQTNGIYEIYYRFAIKAGDTFKMEPGYENFKLIRKGERLATSNGKEVIADHDSRVFMPLYQSQGDDGFFAIRPIPKLALKLSEIFRNLKLDRLLPLLPGVKWASSKRDALLLNKKIARFMAKDIMHLMGYRSRLFDKEYILVKNREAASKHEQYINEEWFKTGFKIR